MSMPDRNSNAMVKKMFSLRHMLVAAACLLGLCLAAPAAQAEEFGVASFSTELSSPQAGASADFNLKFALNKVDPSSKVPAGIIKDQVIDLPAGMIGDPTAVTATCSMANVAPVSAIERCPATSVAGVAKLRLFNTAANGVIGPFTDRVYRVDPYPGEVAAFAFTTLSSYLVRLSVTVDPSNGYRIRVSSHNQQAGMPLVEADVTMWGVPQDHQGPGPYTQIAHPETFGGPLPAAVPRRRFMSVPARCDKPLVTTMLLASWQTRQFIAPVNSEITTPTGCDQMGFSPWLEVEPAISQAATPSGYKVALQLGQNEDPATPRTANLKDAVVTLPHGVAISPSVANGLEACTDAQLAIRSAADETCPPASKIGDVVLESPVLDHPVDGSIYVGSQLSDDPASGEMFRIFVTATDSGLKIKLLGQVTVDPVTGQITTKFLENPDLPLKKLTLNFKGGDRAPLTTPSTCGPQTTNSSFTSWGGQASQASSSFNIDKGCGQPGFTPGFEAGTANPVAGDSSPFTLRVTRPDGDQNVASIGVNLPEGLLAKLAGVPLCPDAQAATGDCPAASQVGTTTVAAGGGAYPVYVPQPGHPATAVYLAGPYKGAPYSLVVKVPAQAGPFNLGTVAVRNALHIDPTTTAVTATSDPLPQVLAGVPISYRDIRIEMNRPGFMVNPTSCDPMQVKGSIGSASGANAAVSRRFQVADCAALEFKPKLALRLSGAPPRRGANPALKATLTPAAGQANIGAARVILPATELLEQGHIKTVCTRVQFAASECPAGSIYGHAKAWTPLLDRPLEGPVYLRSNGGERKLPDLVADLNGSIHVVLVGYIDSVKRHGSPRIRTRFLKVPDAPVSRFVLEMQRGKKSLLANTTNLCKAKPRAEVSLTGQNAADQEARPRVKVRGCDKSKAHKKSKSHEKK
jgi:hypothetical protein